MNGTIQGTRANQTEKLIAYPPTPGSNSGTNTKALGSSSEAELATWYEEANAYYNAVQSGQETQPDPASWNEFLNQMRWAYDQLMGIPAWDPLPTSGSLPITEQAEAQADPFGARMGTNGRLVHTEEKVRFGFIGDDKRDIWSNEIDIDVAPLSANVQVAKTMDESLDPPEEVLKIVVTDPATGTQAVYIIHDYEDATIRINVPSENQIEDLTGLDPSPIEVGKFESAQEAGSPQASIPGKAHEDLDDYTIYEDRMGKTIEFYPEPSGEEGHEEIHEVYGDSKIVTLPSDHVVVSKGMPDNPDGYTVIVKHRDGSIDKYYIHKGFEVELNAKDEYITWADGTQSAEEIEAGLHEGMEDGVPEFFEENFTLNASSQSQNSNGPNSEDTPTDDVDGDTAIYNSSDNVSIHNDFDGKIKTHDITTAGTVEIIASNYGDFANVILLPNGNYIIRIGNNNDLEGDIIEYHLQGPPSQILLQGFLPGSVRVYQAENNSGDMNSNRPIYNFKDGEIRGELEQDQLDALNSIQVTSPNAINPSEEAQDIEYPKSLQDLMTLTEKNPEQILNALRDAGIDGYDTIEDLIEAIEQNGGEFPIPLDSPEHIQQVIDFLYALDPVFSSYVDGANQWDANVLSTNYQKAAERLVDLMDPLYLRHENIRTGQSKANPDKWWRNNEIKIGDQLYNFTNENRGYTDTGFMGRRFNGNLFTNTLGVSRAEPNEKHPDQRSWENH